MKKLAALMLLAVACALLSPSAQAEKGVKHSKAHAAVKTSKKTAKKTVKAAKKVVAVKPVAVKPVEPVKKQDEDISILPRPGSGISR